MVNAHPKRERFPVKDLPGNLPQTPVFDGEDSLDVGSIAQDFLDHFGAAVDRGDWDTWEGLWLEDGWWKDRLTLTFDTRTLHGVSAITKAWKQLCPTRKTSGWILDTASAGVDMGPPAWIRVAPTMASLDINFSFTLADPSSICVGVMKLLPVHSGGSRSWKIWILTTNSMSLGDHPFRKLPLATRDTPSLILDSQRGQPTAQGLPTLAKDAVFDAVVIGFSSCGMSNTIQLESIGLNTIAFDFEPVAGGFWATKRYEAIQLHHSKRMIQLPQFPPAERYSKFMRGAELSEYYSDAIRELQLPTFAGVRVNTNSWDEATQLWTSEIQDVMTGQKMFIKSKNLVMSNGFLMSGMNRPRLPGEHDFEGTIQHSSQVTISKPFTDKDVLVVGSGTSAHDIAAQLVKSGLAKSVSLLQRSPTVMMEFETLFKTLFARYQGNLPVDAADMLDNGLPIAVARPMAMGLFKMLIGMAEPMYQQLEGKGYLVDRNPDVIKRQYEDRGRAVYLDHPKTLDLVLNDKIRIIRGGAKAFTRDGVVTQYQNEPERTVKADAVVFATGYKDADFPDMWSKSGFLDKESAERIENPGKWGVDKEGELIGYITDSGHPNLFFAALTLLHARYIGRFAAIQVMTNVTGTTPKRYTREQ